MLAQKLRLSLHVIMTVFLAGFLVACSQPTHAETKIAVVDVQKLLSESKAAVNIQEQLKKQREDFQKELAAVEEKLRSEEKAILEEREKLTKEELQAKAQEFETKILEARQEVDKKRRTLEQAANKAVFNLRQEVVQVVADIADENAYNLVITRQNVVLAEKSMEITDQVMKELNKKVTEIKLEMKTN